MLHIFRVDKPLFGSTSRRTIENFTRAETVGYPDVFTFRLEIVKENLLDHGSNNP